MLIHWDKLPEGFKGIQKPSLQVGSGLSQTPEKVATFQQTFVIPWFDGITSYFCLYVVVEEKSISYHDHHQSPLCNRCISTR